MLRTFFPSKINLSRGSGQFPFLKKFPDADVALSLKRLSSAQTDVVRVRRTSDNAERNFKANEISGSQLKTWVTNDNPDLPLDQDGDAHAAYSLRNLKSDIETEVVRVRRLSDNEEKDFSAEEIINGTLTDWVGSSDGAVTIWYDQTKPTSLPDRTGHNDFVQTTEANQPLVVKNGELILINGKPSIAFDGVNDHLTATEKSQFNFLHHEPSSVFMVSQIEALGTNKPAAFLSSGTGAFASSSVAFYLGVDNRDAWSHTNRIVNAVSNGSSYVVGNAQQEYFPDEEQMMVTTFTDPANATASQRAFSYLKSVKELNNNTSTLTPSSDDSANLLTMMRMSNDYLKGNVQELVIYSTLKFDERLDIEGNIINHYGIGVTNVGGQVSNWYDQRVPTTGSKLWFDGVDSTGVSVNLNEQIFPSSGDFDVEIDVYYNGYDVTSTHDFYLSQDTATSDILGFGISGNQQFRAFARNVSNQLTGPVATPGVHTLRLTRVGNLWSFYVNGVFQESMIESSNPASVNTIVGNNLNLSGNRHVKGSVFNIRKNGVLLYSGDYGDEPWTNKVTGTQGSVNGTVRRFVVEDDEVLSHDAFQKTAAEQPAVVKNGALITNTSGKPMIQGDSVNDFLEIPSFTGGTLNTSLLLGVIEPVTGGEDRNFVTFGSSSNRYYFASHITIGDPSTGLTLNTTVGSTNIVAVEGVDSSFKTLTNGVQVQAPTTITGDAGLSISRIFRSVGSLYSDTKAGELIIFRKDKSADTLNIIAARNKQWKVY